MILRRRLDLVPTVLFAALLVTALVFRHEIRGWLSLAGPEREPAPPTVTDEGVEPGPEIAPHRFSEPALHALDAAFEDYEQVRASLAADRLEGIEERGRSIVKLVRRASEAAEGAPEAISQRLLEAGAAAEELSSASDLAAARSAFGPLSAALVTLATADPRLQDDRHVFHCPMTEGYDRWVQPSSTLENPYMGTEMLTCGGPSSFEAAVDDAASPEPAGVRRQRTGVRIGEVTRGTIHKRVRTIGNVTYDETKIVEVTLKYDAWVEKLYAEARGVRVKRGEALAAVYSPELYAAQGALDAAGAGRGSNGDVGSARRRLSLLDAEGLSGRVSKTGRISRTHTVASPATGYVVDKHVNDGSAVKAGQPLFRIAGLDTVWIEAELYEHEVPLIEPGQPAVVSLSYMPDRRYEGEVTYVYPALDPDSRTGRARIELHNPDLELRPDMYCNVAFDIELSERLRVPASAVIHTGTRKLVFVALGEGRFLPREVQLGVRAGDHYEVTSGLREGEKVATSGSFMIAAESQLRSAVRDWDPEGPERAEQGPNPEQGGGGR